MTIQLRNQPASNIQRSLACDDNLSENFMAAIDQKKRDAKMQRHHLQYDETSAMLALQALIALPPQYEIKKPGLSSTKEQQAAHTTPMLSLNDKKITNGKSKNTLLGSDRSRCFSLRARQKTIYKKKYQLLTAVFTPSFSVILSPSVNSEMKHATDLIQEQKKPGSLVSHQDVVPENVLWISQPPMAGQSRTSLSPTQSAPIPKEVQFFIDTCTDQAVFSNIPHKNINLEHQGGEAELNYPISDKALARLTLSENIITPTSENAFLNNLLTAQSALASGEWTRQQINDVRPFYLFIREAEKKNTEKAIWPKSEKEKK